MTRKELAAGLFVLGADALALGSVAAIVLAEREKRNRVKIGGFEFTQKQLKTMEELQKHPDQLIFQAHDTQHGR